MKAAIQRLTAFLAAPEVAAATDPEIRAARRRIRSGCGSTGLGSRLAARGSIATRNRTADSSRAWTQGRSRGGLDSAMGRSTDPCPRRSHFCAGGGPPEVHLGCAMMHLECTIARPKNPGREGDEMHNTRPDPVTVTDGPAGWWGHPARRGGRQWSIKVWGRGPDYGQKRGRSKDSWRWCLMDRKITWVSRGR